MTIPVTVAWTPDGVVVLDQSRLPNEERYLTLRTVDEVADAIRDLRVRGAPLIGIVGAMGVALAATQPGDDAAAAVRRRADQAGRLLAETRPTAVNLRWAIDRMLAVTERTMPDARRLAEALIREAQAIHAEDRAMCEAIGDHGLALVPDGAIVLTHCNAGSLATGGIGTALAPVYRAHQAGRRVHVIADETRPVLQGGRLTAWELTRAGVPCTLIADSMAASRLRKGDVTCVIVGADRIAANGDTANKIGTYPLALAAKAHDVPFYVAAPASTFDLATATGALIPIEERHAGEITMVGDRRIAPQGVAVWNPAFDVTPASLITGFITDRGLLTRP
jgi:methylthioribose-1-phosphate isomerase